MNVTMATFVQAMRLLPLSDGIRLVSRIVEVYRRKPGSILALTHLVIDHPELEPLLFQLLDGKLSDVALVEIT